MLAGVVALAAVTIALKGAASILRSVPRDLAERTVGLAPALLAALVVVELAGTDGVPEPDAKTAGVVAAAVLAALRAPFALCVLAGAAVAAVLRAL